MQSQLQTPAEEYGQRLLYGPHNDVRAIVSTLSVMWYSYSRVYVDFFCYDTWNRQDRQTIDFTWFHAVF